MRRNVIAVLLLLTAAVPALAEEEGLSGETKKTLAAFRDGDERAQRALVDAPEFAAIATILSRSLSAVPHADHARTMDLLFWIKQNHPDLDITGPIAECVSHENVDCQYAAARCLTGSFDLGRRESQVVRGLIALAMCQRYAASRAAFDVLRRLTSSVKDERDIQAWRSWYEGRYNEMLDVRVPEILAGIEKGQDRLTLNGEEVSDAKDLATRLGDLRSAAHEHGLKLKVWVLAPRSDDPLVMAENERRALESVARPLSDAGLEGVAVPRERIDRPLFDLLPKKREPAPEPPPPVEAGWNGQIVVTAILLDPERGNRVIVVYDDPDRRGRIYAEGEELRDREDRKLPNAKVAKIAEGQVTFVCDGKDLVKPLKEP
jgi:hypothetical protein